MARVEMAVQPWGWVTDPYGTGLSGATVTIKNLDGTNATHYSAITGGSSSTSSITTNSDGTLPQYLEEGTYTLTVGVGTPHRVEAVAGAHMIGVSVLEFGASRNGTTDDRAAFQAAIDAVSAAGGGTVTVPRGSYKLGSTLTLPSNVTIEGLGMSSVLLVNDGWSGSVITATGSLGTAINVVGDYARGASVITTATAHGLAAGDYVRVIGQRNALSSDASNDWRLGYGTPGAGTAYYGEFLQVNIVNSTTQFTAYSGLTFPDYRDDQTLETDVNARPSTTIQKVTFVENAVVRGLRVDVAPGSAISSTSLLRATRARNVQVRDCHVNRGATQGSGVRFYNCLDCTAENVSCEYAQGVALAEADHFKYTAFVAVSSQACEFTGCISRNGGQNFDISYEDTGVVSLFCTVRNARVYSPWSSGMTAHGGSYANSFLDNKMYGVHQGVVCRSRNSVISGNTAIYNGEESGFPTTITHYGYGVYEGWAQDCTISNNIAVGFYTGVAINDASDAGEAFGHIGLAVTGNTFKSCRCGVERFFSGTNVTTDRSGLTVTGNTFHDIGDRAVFLEQVTDYVIADNVGTKCFGGVRVTGTVDGVIANNVFKSSDGVSIGIYIDVTNDRVSVRGNRAHAFLAGVQVANTGNTNITIKDNDCTGCTTPIAPGSGAGLQVSGNRPPDEGIQTLATDADFTLTPHTSPELTRHTGTLTAARAVTLATSGAFKGEKFRITRSGGGAFNLNVGTGPLKALATNTWCEVTHDGTAWRLTAYGTL